MVEFSKGKKMLCRNWSFLLSFLGCENKSTCKVEPRNSWPEEHNSKTRGKEELKLIDSSPCCRPVLVEQLQNEVCSRRGMEIEQWNCWSMCVLAHIGGQAHLWGPCNVYYISHPSRVWGITRQLFSPTLVIFHCGHTKLYMQTKSNP